MFLGFPFPLNHHVAALAVQRGTFTLRFYLRLADAGFFLQQFQLQVREFLTARPILLDSPQPQLFFQCRALQFRPLQLLLQLRNQRLRLLERRWERTIRMELSTHDECLVTENVCGKQWFYAGFMRGALTSSISFRYHGRGLAACEIHASDQHRELFRREAHLDFSRAHLRPTKTPAL